MGDFLFNPSVLTDEFIAEYSSQAKADANFHVAGSPLRGIIAGLKSHNYYLQNPAVSGLASLEWSRVNKDDLFVLGRNLYQAACGGSNAEAYLIHLSLKLGALDKEVAFHILNGMLYEIYFDSSDRFREDKKVGHIAEVFALEGDERFHLSFQFIQQSLRPYSKQLFYVPGSERRVVIDVVVALNKEKKFEVRRIIYDTQEVFYANDGVTLVINFGFTSYMQELSATEFEIKVASLMVVPRNRLDIIFSDSRAKDDGLLFPYNSKIQRLSN